MLKNKIKVRITKKDLDGALDPEIYRVVTLLNAGIPFQDSAHKWQAIESGMITRLMTKTSEEFTWTEF